MGQDGQDQSVTENVMQVHGAQIVFIDVNAKRAISKLVTVAHVHRVILAQDVANRALTNGGVINVTKCVHPVLCLLKGIGSASKAHVY